MSMDVDSIRRRAEKRVKRRYDFYRQVGSYLVANVVVWCIYLFLVKFQVGPFPWPLWVTVFGGISLIKQAVSVFSETHFFEDMRERELQREIEREKDRVYRDGYEKPKNDIVSIGDDGELVYADDSEESVEKHKRTATEQ